METDHRTLYIPVYCQPLSPKLQEGRRSWIRESAKIKPFVVPSPSIPVAQSFSWEHDTENRNSCRKTSGKFTDNGAKKRLLKGKAERLGASFLGEACKAHKKGGAGMLGAWSCFELELSARSDSIHVASPSLSVCICSMNGTVCVILYLSCSDITRVYEMHVRVCARVHARTKH